MRDGSAVPPTLLATRIWDAQRAALGALVPEEVTRTATGGVHGAHDVHVHRPVVPGEPLSIWVARHGVHPAGRHAAVTIRYAVVDGDGAPVADQWWTTVYLGASCTPEGARPPDHAFPEDARARPLPPYEVEVDDDMARRYAEVSGDWSAHHFDVEAARGSGADRVFLHGLCTMALCARAVTAVAADGDPRRVRRIAVRFASPTFLGERLHVALHDAGPGAVAFEAQCAGATVVTNGRAELRG